MCPKLDQKEKLLQGAGMPREEKDKSGRLEENDSDRWKEIVRHSCQAQERGNTHIHTEK